MIVFFIVAVALIVGLTLFGAFISRRAPGNSWERGEDHPIIGSHDV